MQKDFAPIGSVVSLQNIIVVTPTLPAKNLKEYLALARSKPGNTLYASSGQREPGAPRRSAARIDDRRADDTHPA